MKRVDMKRVRENERSRVVEKAGRKQVSWPMGSMGQSTRGFEQ
jgi:hypothetical protein